MAAMFACGCLAQTPAESIQKLMQRGELDEAERRIEAQFRAGNRNATLLGFLGIVKAQRGAWRDAEEYFEQAIRANPDFEPPYLNLARLYAEHAAAFSDAGKKEESAYLRLLARHPDHADATFQLALLYGKRGEAHLTLQHLSRLPDERQTVFQARLVRCWAEATAGNRGAALAAAQQLAAASELDEAGVLWISAAATEKMPEVGEVLLEEAVRRSLAGPESYRALGRIRENQRRFPEAREAYQKAVPSSGAAVPLLVDLARVSDCAGQKTTALGYLAHARQLEPGNAAVHYDFGRICVDLDLPVEALKSFQRATELKPEVPDYHYAYGLALVTNRDPRQAAHEFELLLALKPGNPLGVFSLARAQFEMDEMEEAQKGFLTAVQSTETAAGAHYFLGRIAAGEGDIDGALRELRASLQAYPGGVETIAELGSVYTERRQFDDARTTLSRGLELDPENFRINRALLRLYQRTSDPRAAAQLNRLEELDRKRAEKAKQVQRVIRVEPR